MRRPMCCVTAAVLIGLWCAPALAQQHAPVVAVFLMESKGSTLEADEVNGLTDYMSAKMGESGRFQIIPRDEIKKRLVAAKADTYKDCYDTSCQIEVGKELAAEFSISSSIAKVGSQCLITASVWDLRRSTQIRSATDKAKCDADLLIVSVERVTDKLIDAMNKALNEAPTVRPTEPVAKPEPVAEPEPVAKPEPVARPEPEPVERAEPVAPVESGDAFDQPFVYLSLGIIGLDNLYVDTGDDFFAMGFDFDFDFRLGNSFMLGGYVEYLESIDSDDSYRYGLGMRIGGLIKIGTKVLLVPFGRIGFIGAGVAGSCDEYDCDGAEESLGVRIGGGFGVKVMFLRWLGVGANLQLGYFYFPDYEDSGFVDIGFDLGVVFAF